MADQDDGLELNLDTTASGAGAVAKRPKVTGGRWKDRVRVRKAENRQIRRRERLYNAAAGDERALSQAQGDVQDKGIATSSGAPETDGAAGNGEAEKRGQKRKRDADRPTANGASRADGAEPRPTGAPKQVISSLFNFHEDRLPNVEPTPKRAPAREVAAAATNAPLADIASFDDAGLPEDLLVLLKDKMGVTAPTLIQQRALPRLLRGDTDVFLRAQTGSGKTLAYLLPLLARLALLPEQHRVRASGTFCVVVAPTRELAGQIHAVLVKACNCRSLRWIVPCLLVGGERKKSEKARLRKGATIVVATPGRLKDHLDTTQALDVTKVAFAVLDEADRLMDLGFEQTVRDILAAIDARRQHNRLLADVLPKRRVTILCSATSKGQLGEFGKALLSDAVLIEGDDREAPTTQADNAPAAGSVADAAAVTGESGGGGGGELESIPAQLRQDFITVPTKLRTVTLVALLRNAFPQCKRVIVFLSCADSVDWHFEALSRISPGSGPTAAAVMPAETANGDTATDAGTPAKTRDEAELARTVATADCVREGMEVYRLHGSLPQPVRRATLRRFESSPATQGAVLLSTDVASRGLDTDCDLVIQLDPPFALGDYVHRVGRTARAGRLGRAVLVLLKTEAGYVDYLKSKLSQQQTATIDSPGSAGKAGDMELKEINARSTLRQAFGGKAFEEEATKWQLEYEKYVLTPASTSSSSSSSLSASGKAGRGKSKDKGRPDAKEKSIGETAASNRAARAFTSHVRAYATHIATERKYFPLHELQLGHVAKCFGLREAPSRIAAVAQSAPGAGGAQKKRKHNADNRGDEQDTAAERMRRKMAALRSGAGGGADEYNLY